VPSSRRSFLRQAGAAGVAVGGGSLLAACSPSSPASTAATPGAAAAPTTAPTFKFSISHHVPAGHLVDQASIRFADLVKDRTKGNVTFTVHPAAQLAGLRAGTEGVQLGTIDMVWADFGTLANWQPHLGFISLPFLFNDFDHVFKVLYGSVGEKLKKELRETLGIAVIGYGPSGFRVIATTKQAIKSAADLQGVKMRVPEIPVYVDTFKALGANPTPLPFGEVYTGLQTGVIEGVEAPAEAIFVAKHQEVTKYVSKTYHIFTDVHLLMNQKKFVSMPSEYQKIFVDAGKEVVEDWYKKEIIAGETKFWNELAAKLQATPDPDVASFRTKVASVVQKFSSQSPAAKELVEAVQAAGR